MGAIENEFNVDRRFGSLDEATEFLMHEYVQELPARVWSEHASGLMIPHWAPKYLFRGECGCYPTTVAGCYRSGAYRVRDGRQLTSSDTTILLHLLPALARRFSDKDYSLAEHSAIGLLQHYGLPTWLIDFTCHAGHALSFAGSGDAKIGRICVFPVALISPAVTVVDLMEHPWCDRPRRQRAFGVIMPPNYQDLKNMEVRRALGLRWYEFPIPDENRPFLQTRHAELIRLDNDPSGGFVRHHLTEYVEAHGKLSPLLTDWLLERVPMSPRCGEIKSFDQDEVVVHHWPSSVMGEIDYAVEENWSRRYWSIQFPDSSWDRMKGWTWPPVGSIYADPRTFHGSPTGGRVFPK